MSVEDLEKLLSKYIAVWLWSILFGANSALIYSLVNYRADKWGSYGLALAMLVTLSAVFVFSSFFTLLRYLRYFLLPSVFGPSESKGDGAGNEAALHKVDGDKAAQHLLAAACRFLVMAAILRACTTLAEMFFMSLQGF
jgi:hypothetical protein